MANSLENKLVVANPDFTTIKENLKNFLRSQSTFTDYDFEGSGLSNLLDILAYNTHYLAFYANMIANESFLDTASTRDAVVSHAKMLGYTPTSTTSSKANVDLIFTQANNAGIASMTSLTIPRFTRFSGVSMDGVNYTFCNLKQTTVTKADNSFTFSDLQLTEGKPVNFVYTYNQQLNPLQEFVIPDTNVDTSTLEVIIQNSAVDLTQKAFTLASDATTVSQDSTVYYLDAINDGKYKIYFGDDILGKKLSDGNIVVISYLRSRGSISNKTNKFTLIDSVNGLSSGTIVVKNVANGGTDGETLNQIKFAATKSYLAQNRAITKSDYISLIKQNYPSLEAVNVWGGEENVPPVYGKIFISAKPAAGYEIPTTEKQYILNEVVRPLSMVTVTPEFVDPDYNFLNLDITVKYDPTATTKTPGQIESLVRSAVYNYANTNLNAFNSYFKISRMSRDIDNIDTSIVSNEIDIKIEKRLEPTLSTAAKNYTINFYTPIQRGFGNNKVSTSPAYVALDNDNIARNFFLEEVPQSTTGIKSITVTAGGSGFTTAPTIVIQGDGYGATAEAIITNGKITSVVVTHAGSEYSTAAIKAYDSSNTIISSVVLEPVYQGTTGKLRSYYFDNNQIKTVYSEDAGTIDYASGTITLTNFTASSINNADKVLKIYATPENSLFGSSKNAIITVDSEDTAAVSVSVTPIT